MLRVNLAYQAQRRYNDRYTSGGVLGVNVLAGRLDHGCNGFCASCVSIAQSPFCSARMKVQTHLVPIAWRGSCKAPLAV